MYIFLDNPQLKPENQIDSRLKSRTLSEFELIANKLYRRPTTLYPDLPRLVVPESEVFDTVVHEHLQLLHAGHDKVWAAVRQKYYRINRQEVRAIIRLCKNCALNRPATIKAPLQPIISKRTWERVQLDHIDMRHEPSDQYKWIMHLKDHFSKYIYLYPLKNKHTEPIVKAFV